MTMGSQGAAVVSFLYFAYGSNLCSQRIRLNNPSAVVKGIGRLQGYRLEFAFMSKRWRGAAANIYPDATSHVYGVLWELSNNDQASLDDQEGVRDGIYERIAVTPLMNGQPVDCVAYQITQATRNSAMEAHGSNNLLPSTVYKNVIILGAIEHNLPPEYIEHLKAIPDNGYSGEVDVKIRLSEKDESMCPR